MHNKTCFGLVKMLFQQCAENLLGSVAGLHHSCTGLEFFEQGEGGGGEGGRKGATTIVSLISLG